MPELQVPQTGETIESGTFGQPVVFRVLSRYTNAAQRDALAPSPGDGEPAYVQDIDALQVYDGTAWVTYQPTVQTLRTEVNLTEGPVGGWEWWSKWTYDGVSAVTVSFDLRPNGITPGEGPETIPAAIPLGLEPNSNDLVAACFPYNFANQLIDKAPDSERQVWALEFRTDRSVYMPNMQVASIPDGLGYWRGTFTYHIGADGINTVPT